MEGQFTIVYIDDSVSMCESSASLLKTVFREATIVSAHNLTDGEARIDEAVKGGGPAVVVTDINYISGMKDLTGLELLDRVHQKYPSIPCIVFSSIPIEARDRCMALHVPFFDKGEGIKETMRWLDAMRDATVNGPGSGNFAPREAVASGAKPIPT